MFFSAWAIDGARPFTAAIAAANSNERRVFGDLMSSCMVGPPAMGSSSDLLVTHATRTARRIWARRAVAPFGLQGRAWRHARARAVSWSARSRDVVLSYERRAKVRRS